MFITYEKTDLLMGDFLNIVKRTNLLVRKLVSNYCSILIFENVPELVSSCKILKIFSNNGKFFTCYWPICIFV